MPQFRVVVPPTVREGQVVRAYVGGNYSSAKGASATASHHPQTVNVRVPKGAVPGDAFIFEISQDRIDELLRGGGSGSKAKSPGSSSSPGTASSTAFCGVATGVRSVRPSLVSLPCGLT